MQPIQSKIKKITMGNIIKINNKTRINKILMGKMSKMSTDKKNKTNKMNKMNKIIRIHLKIKIEYL
jgi:hypothetical protein